MAKIKGRKELINELAEAQYIFQKYIEEIFKKYNCGKTTTLQQLDLMGDVLKKQVEIELNNDMFLKFKNMIDIVQEQHELRKPIDFEAWQCTQLQ